MYQISPSLDQAKLQRGRRLFVGVASICIGITLATTILQIVTNGDALSGAIRLAISAYLFRSAYQGKQFAYWFLIALLMLAAVLFVPTVFMFKGIAQIIMLMLVSIYAICSMILLLPSVRYWVKRDQLIMLPPESLFIDVRNQQ